MQKKNDCSNVITLRNINNVLHCTVDKEHFLKAEVCIENISIETASTKNAFIRFFNFKKISHREETSGLLITSFLILLSSEECFLTKAVKLLV